MTANSDSTSVHSHSHPKTAPAARAYATLVLLVIFNDYNRWCCILSVPTSKEPPNKAVSNNFTTDKPKLINRREANLPILPNHPQWNLPNGCLNASSSEGEILRRNFNSRSLLPTTSRLCDTQVSGQPNSTLTRRKRTLQQISNREAHAHGSSNSQFETSVELQEKPSVSVVE